MPENKPKRFICYPGGYKNGRTFASEIRRIPAEYLAGLGEVRESKVLELEAAAGDEPFAIDLNIFTSEENTLEQLTAEPGPELKTSKQLTDNEIRSSLSDTVCLGCGRKKKRRMSHCSKCYYALSPELRKDLYKTFGCGYEEAFRASIDALREKIK